MTQRTTKPTIRLVYYKNSEDSDKPVHPCSLIRVLADRMCFLQPPDYPKRDKWEPLAYWVDVQADIWA